MLMLYSPSTKVGQENCIFTFKSQLESSWHLRFLTPACLHVGLKNILGETYLKGGNSQNK